MPSWLSRWRLVPLDHYTALEIDPAADAEEITRAHESMLRRVQSSTWRRCIAQLLGQSPACLLQARDELLDPVARRSYDAYLDRLRIIYSNPPH